MKHQNSKFNHIHTPYDGRRPRSVFVNGKVVNGCFFADTKRGIVKAFRYPLKLNKNKKELLSYVIRGTVFVVENES